MIRVTSPFPLFFERVHFVCVAFHARLELAFLSLLLVKALPRISSFFRTQNHIFGVCERDSSSFPHRNVRVECGDPPSEEAGLSPEFFSPRRQTLSLFPWTRFKTIQASPPFLVRILLMGRMAPFSFPPPKYSRRRRWSCPSISFLHFSALELPAQPGRHFSLAVAEDNSSLPMAHRPRSYSHSSGCDAFFPIIAQKHSPLR